MCWYIPPPALVLYMIPFKMHGRIVLAKALRLSYRYQKSDIYWQKYRIGIVYVSVSQSKYQHSFGLEISFLESISMHFQNKHKVENCHSPQSLARPWAFQKKKKFRFTVVRKANNVYACTIVCKLEVKKWLGLPGILRDRIWAASSWRLWRPLRWEWSTWRRSPEWDWPPPRSSRLQSRGASPGKGWTRRNQPPPRWPGPCWSSPNGRQRQPANRQWPGSPHPQRPDNINILYTFRPTVILEQAFFGPILWSRNESDWLRSIQFLQNPNIYSQICDFQPNLFLLGNLWNFQTQWWNSLIVPWDGQFCNQLFKV